MNSHQKQLFKMIREIFVIYLFLKCCTGQILLGLFPLIKDTTSNLEFELAKTRHAVNLSTIQTNTVLTSTIKNPYKVADIFRTTGLPSYSSQVADLFISEFNDGATNEDVRLNFGQLLTKYGREFETHEVTTKDGYVLTLCRIIGSKEPVFLMHGLLGSAEDFIIAGPDNGLAYLLAQQEYDVWLGNARGNKMSRTHIALSSSAPAFWDFSWHEIGIFDLPAMIDYVLEATNRTSLKYIGHSQGTTVFFVMASEKPEYNKKISQMLALSPVAFMSRVRAPIIRLMAPGMSLLRTITKSTGQYEFLPDSKVTMLMKKLICGSGKLADVICSNMIVLTYGYDYTQLNVTNLPVVFSHLPAGASMKQFIHYGQGLIHEDFKMFDYGSMENSEKYGSMLPPSYNLGHITAPIWMFCSESDWMSHPEDVEILRRKLKSVMGVYKISHKEFNTLDFIIAKDVVKFVYGTLLKVISLL